LSVTSTTVVVRAADALWPDAAGDDAIQMEGGRLTFSALGCAVDAWAFESLATRALSSPDPDEALASAKRALALYRGSFLPEERNAAWALAARERLRARHVRLVLGAVERGRERGSFDAARAALERAIEVEPTEKRFRGELAAEYTRAGRAADAQAVLGRRDSGYSSAT
jgi:DNA-binding SARP family transcriptional activator